MIGTKFYKGKYDRNEYDKAVEWCDKNNATIVFNGDFYEVCEMPKPTQEEINAIEMERLKAELSATDYKCLKYVDGALTESEYAEVKAYRAELRARINELEG